MCTCGQVGRSAVDCLKAKLQKSVTPLVLIILLYAVTGLTAAEIIHKTVDASKPNMGLMT